MSGLMPDRPPRLSHATRLVLVAMHGAEGPMYSNDVCDSMRLDQGTVLRVYQQLEHEGYVRRTAAPPDAGQSTGRPRNYFELTDEGHELAEALLPEMRRQTAALARGLGLELAPAKGLSMGPMGL